MPGYRQPSGRFKITFFVHVEVDFQGLFAAFPGQRIHIELTFVVGAAFQYFEGAAAAFALVAKHFAAGPKHDIGVALLVAPPPL